MTVHMRRHKEGGSALIWIFLAVALFAALNFAISRTNQSGGIQMLSDQQATILATEIINFSVRVENVVQRLLMQGCSENEISFGNEVYTRYDGELSRPMDHNPNAPDDFRCHIFHAKGGGVRPVIVPDAALLPPPNPTGDMGRHGHASIQQAIIPGVGREDEPEILLTVPWLHPDVCRKINDMAGIEQAPGEIPAVNVTGGRAYNGQFSGSPRIFDNPAIEGKTSFCLSLAGHSRIHLYRVLIPR